MAKTGDYNRLPVSHRVDFGIYLQDEDQQILLPLRYCPEDAEEGDFLTVFIYRDSEDRLIATTEQPLAIAGEVAFLEIVASNQGGAYADMGLAKDLFIPLREQATPLLEGGIYPLYIYLDEKSDRLVGTARLNRFISDEAIDLEEGTAVMALVIKQTDLGYSCVVNNKFWGLLYTNQIFKTLAPGELITAYVQKMREDGRLDLTLQAPGITGLTDASKQLLQALQGAGGHLPLGDKSESAEIQTKLGISKKTFKRAAGILLKSGQVRISDHEIYLLGNE